MTRRRTNDTIAGAPDLRPEGAALGLVILDFFSLLLMPLLPDVLLEQALIVEIVMTLLRVRVASTLDSFRRAIRGGFHETSEEDGVVETLGAD